MKFHGNSTKKKTYEAHKLLRGVSTTQILEMQTFRYHIALFFPNVCLLSLEVFVNTLRPIEVSGIFFFGHKYSLNIQVGEPSKPVVAFCFPFPNFKKFLQSRSPKNVSRPDLCSKVYNTSSMKSTSLVSENFFLHCKRFFHNKKLQDVARKKKHLANIGVKKCVLVTPAVKRVEKRHLSRVKRDRKQTF